MKIIAIGRNYAEHAKELGNLVPKETVFFMKPETALIKNNQDFYYPDFTNDLHYETEFVVKISQVGKNIQEKFAHRYYDEVTMGIDFTARDLQRKCKEEGLPWEVAKAFDGSAPVGKFVSKEKFSDINNINFSLKMNDSLRQQGNTGEMIFSIDKLIAYVSRFVTLKIGDLLFTGTPAGVGAVKVGDHLQAFMEGENLLDFYVK